MIPGSIDQCLMSFTKSVKQHRLDNTKRKQKYLMNESNLSSVVIKKRIKLVEKNSINLSISDKKTDNDQFDCKYKLQHKKTHKSKTIQSKLLNNICTSSIIRGKTWLEGEKLSLVNSSVFRRKPKALMNSTEMDFQQSIKMSKSLHDSSCSGYQSNGSSNIEFPVCIKDRSSDCSCEKCWENVFKNESWNESNLLSSTRVIEMPKKDHKFFRNNRVEINPISKKSKNLRRVIKIKENIRAKTTKKFFMSNDDRNFENYTSMVPISSNENFTKFGDFLVWYV